MAPTSMSIGRLRRRASAKVAPVHGCHRIGPSDAARRYGLDELRKASCGRASVSAGEAAFGREGPLKKTSKQTRIAQPNRIRVDKLIFPRYQSPWRDRRAQARRI